MKKLYVLSVVLFLYSFNFCFAEVVETFRTEMPELILGETVSQTVLPLLHHEDSEGSLDPESLLTSGTHDLIPDGRFTYPYNRSVHWFGVVVKNSGSFERALILHADEPFLDSIILYTKSTSGWRAEQNGLKVPLSERVFRNRYPAFLINLQPGEEKTVLLRVSTERTMLNVGFHLENPDSFAVEEQLKGALYLIFIGGILSIFFYNLFLLISLKEPLYLYYVIYAFFQGIWVLLYSGYDVYLFSDYRVNHFLSCGISISSISLILFISQIFETRKNMPGIYRLIKYLIPVLSLLAVATIFNVRLYALVVSAGIPVTLFLLGIILTGFIKRLPQSGYLLFGMGGYVLGLFLISGVNMGFIPFSEFTRYTFLAGSFIEFIMFSITLASRVQTLQKNTNLAQQKMLQMEHEANTKLTILVNEKTEKLQKANAELNIMVVRDSLTGLYNRRYLEEFLNREWARHQRNAKSLSIMMIDIDYFKLYNDSFGHLQGDDCLIHVSRVLEESVYRSSDLVARYGGEEFLIALPECDGSYGGVVAERVLGALKDQNLHHVTESGYVTVSIGLASTTPEKENTWDMLIKQADKALYKSKSEGRNRYTRFSDI